MTVQGNDYLWPRRFWTLLCLALLAGCLMAGQGFEPMGQDYRNPDTGKLILIGGGQNSLGAEQP